MTISIHLVSIPDQEAVTSRVVHLPADGGTIGRSPDCSVVLPDHTTRISRKHAEITRTSDGFFLKDTSNNGVSLNAKALQKGADYAVNDGDIITIEGYSLLVSTLVVSQTSQSAEIDDNDTPTFTLNLANDDTDFLESFSRETQPKVQQRPHYSSENVLQDDPFSSDPFEDFSENELSKFEEVEKTLEPLPLDHGELENNTVEFLPINQDNHHIVSSLQQLIALSEKNHDMLQNPSFQHDALFSALEQTIDTFLDEFSPQQLEPQFDEYMGSSLFVSKDKRYWRIYRKHFERRQQNGEFRRHFKALFIENMQRSGEKS
ncbi:FHA domain-containing protein [Vibrio sp. ZSDZ65]|uniref:FHA domain-containing protein n=1 Tax=Vibrio qingdaonensis TaxID=2829491 RepID=A0A9X3CJX1_9VIBR|nr:FHA domain-containing protein [Vibrio qingdaonensis]MCW8344590.1 FHA domain-containing protein [Vibrio qingdaonensis]